MSLDSFHPLVARWFTTTLGDPTPTQSRGWRAIRGRRHTLIAAPTGSGKTLAAFLTALDELFVEGLSAPLPDEVRVVYVSPLKALSADIHKNLGEPRRGIRTLAEAEGLQPPLITAAVRTGDTTGQERAAMLRRPPHILVTTPESLYLLLTAERSRAMLRTVRTVIVDEIHAVIGTRRGAHLALSLERLQHIASAPLVRIGLSATQKPIEEVAQFLVGTDRGRVDIIDAGHRRAIDLGLEIPGAPLEAVMSHEVWQDYYERLAALVRAHRTTLVFVNTRRMAERITRDLTERLGDGAVTAHHGSLSKDRRLDAEMRLKNGQLKALVATASLELGIDIGHVDLVCQIGSPHRIATLLQRVGRSGHSIHGLPKGRMFPASRDDLVECAALLRSVRRGELDRIVVQEAPLDVLAQQLVAEAACDEYAEQDLFDLVRRAWPYRDLSRADFDAVLKMTADGFATSRGRRAALLHRDEVNARIRGRRSTRSLAITSGGAIPEVADYRVVLEPEETFIGTVNEDFAIESMAGDIFQLGNASWQVLQVGPGIVRVADAKGAPPNIPFWFGEAPARSDELSRAVSDLRAELDAMCAEAASEPPQAIIDWLFAETGIPPGAAEQIAAYLIDARRALGVLPTQQTLVLERFFDESGGMQLVLHAPFGSRVNKAWGLALRKRFCRQFNFELQAAATEDAILLSLGPQHSFPLSDVFRYLHPATARDVLVQAFLDAPVFQTRWRWNTTISLAVPRNRRGKKVPPQLQRMLADDLMAAVFPDAAACLENIPGDRQLPDHPLVNQTVRDCLQEAMDFDALAAILSRIHAGELRLVSCDTPEPSPLVHDILNARPYSFLDDAPLEERRTQAVYARRATQPATGGDLGALDPDAIDRVRDEARPDPRDADELHDALLTAGFLTETEAAALPPDLFATLAAARRATIVRIRGNDGGARGLWLAAERIPELLAIQADVERDDAVQPPASRASRAWTREEAVVELLRGRMTILGPTTAAELAESLAIRTEDVSAALVALESEGVILRGRFTHPPSSESIATEWCDRRLLARIHRYTLNRLRAEIDPVAPADFMRFLFSWQHADGSSRLTGIDGLRTIVGVLDGFELAASAWERSVLPTRMDRYEPAMLDTLCLTGEVGWARLSRPDPVVSDIVAATPIALFLREHADVWCETGERDDPADEAVLDALRTRGALFFHEIDAACGLGEKALRTAIARLVAAGLITSDGFAGVRALLNSNTPLKRAGRWSVVRRTSLSGEPPSRMGASAGQGPPSRMGASAGQGPPSRAGASARQSDAIVETHARALLRRYGVVFRRLLARETIATPWRDLVRVYRRLEARGEIRGGRFVSGMSGEQFALPEAVERMREVRRGAHDGLYVTISAADPLNLTGVVTTGERVRAIAGHRIVYRNGVPLAVLEGEYLRPLAEIAPNLAAEVATALVGRPMPPILSGFVGAISR